MSNTSSHQRDSAAPLAYRLPSHRPSIFSGTKRKPSTHTVVSEAKDPKRHRSGEQPFAQIEIPARPEIGEQTLEYQHLQGAALHSFPDQGLTVTASEHRKPQSQAKGNKEKENVTPAPAPSPPKPEAIPWRRTLTPADDPESGTVPALPTQGDTFKRVRERTVSASEPPPSDVEAARILAGIRVDHARWCAAVALIQLSKGPRVEIVAKSASEDELSDEGDAGEATIDEDDGSDGESDGGDAISRTEYAISGEVDAEEDTTDDEENEDEAKDVLRNPSRKAKTGANQILRQHRNENEVEDDKDREGSYSLSQESGQSE
ncbi:hypothetical protein BKA62DRAFT_675729 [Auriculariales sp. MPI-PUGE-AT-0066]|nr:hypothetical protein BKA62DRAFT_675729 [Auriculariales sp. MPI-PUGE-AT-0066]